ncbi:hypothetical protein [Mesorhizobium sp. M1403]|uniref:hypothetical protein n=1 Tax=Mesorhizobium sp. M1403 TaxID=2957097 RepID=UPI0033374DBB
MLRLGVVRHLSDVVRVEILPAHRPMDEMLGLSVLTRFTWPHLAPVWQSSRPAYAHRRASTWRFLLRHVVGRDPPPELVRACPAKIERRAGERLMTWDGCPNGEL